LPALTGLREPVAGNDGGAGRATNQHEREEIMKNAIIEFIGVMVLFGLILANAVIWMTF